MFLKNEYLLISIFDQGIWVAVATRFVGWVSFLNQEVRWNNSETIHQVELWYILKMWETTQYSKISITKFCSWKYINVTICKNLTYFIMITFCALSVCF